jgi:drug/metabolite transporter (DMT)-like permease
VLAAIKVPTMIIGACLLIGTGLPAPESIAYAAASASVFVAYSFFLIRAYDTGDLNLVYPVARGIAPIGVAVLSGVFAGEWLTFGETAGLLVICVGILMLAANRAVLHAPEAILSAIGVGACITCYTIFDGIGGRASGNPLAYTALGNILSGIPLLAFAALRRRGALVAFIVQEGSKAAAGGVLMFAGYAVVIYAMTLAPMARIAALRETSVVFAALIGAALLKEPVAGLRIVAAVIVAVGVMALVMGGAAP